MDEEVDNDNEVYQWY